MNGIRDLRMARSPLSVLSATLFNVYAEEIMKKALEDETIGVRVNGIPINNIRYADDTALIATDLEDLQRIINKVTEASEEWKLSVNERLPNL